ncbi:MAG TPA: hypothetical protein VGI75_08480 [Pirellulales bacterium]|jgi:hypothetical protein
MFDPNEPIDVLGDSPARQPHQLRRKRNPLRRWTIIWLPILAISLFVAGALIEKINWREVEGWRWVNVSPAAMYHPQDYPLALETGPLALYCAGKGLLFSTGAIVIWGAGCLIIKAAQP